MELEELVANLPKREIHGPQGLYLTRYLLFGDLFEGPAPCSAFIHHFHTPDQDRDLHNHPWAWSESLVLKGGYVERRSYYSNTMEGLVPYGKDIVPFSKRGRQTHLVGEKTIFNLDDYHAIDHLIGDTWTLFTCGEAIRDWGFWVPGKGHVSHKNYLGVKTNEPE